MDRKTGILVLATSMGFTMACAATLVADEPRSGGRRPARGQT